MLSTMDTQKLKVDRLLWVLIISLAAAGLAGNYYFSQESVLIRVVSLLVLTGVLAAIAYQTSGGRKFWALLKESVQETRRVVWPTRQETIQTTLAVLGMVVVMGLLLWTADFILLRAVAFLTGHLVGG
jgi:preprotein translocase subunit SecE